VRPSDQRWPMASPDALSREQARGRTSTSACWSRHHEPLHPLDALWCAFATRSQAAEAWPRFGRGKDMEITTYLESAMTPSCRQSCDLWPGRRADSKPYAFRAALGIEQDRVDRRDGPARVGDPRRYARASDAHPAARDKTEREVISTRRAMSSMAGTSGSISLTAGRELCRNVA